MNRKVVWMSLAAIHLALAGAGAAGLPLLSPDTLPGNALAGYREASGSDNSYGFFAPAVGSSKRVRYTLTDASGVRRVETLDSVRATQEITFRVGTILDRANASDEKLRRVLLASLAAHAFGAHRDAQRVHVAIEAYAIPRMEDFRQGKQPRWIALFEAEFARKEGL